MRTVVHITHEATHKIGGIGTVLEGLITSPEYQRAVDRTLLVGTWSLGTPPEARLGDGESRVLYSLCDGIDAGGWRERFRSVEEKYHVWITYGLRTLRNAAAGTAQEVEVLLIEAAMTDPDRLAYFKGTVYQRFGVPSGDYEHIGDYEHWFRIAEPAYEAILALAGESEELYLLSHEYMGMPTLFKALLERAPHVRTVFYAHEVATVRPLVENHPGHDTRFYNAMWQARAQGLYLEDVFGSQWGLYKHALVSRAFHCDQIFAVGDAVVEELRFLGPEFTDAPVRLVYNGIPATEITLEERFESKRRLQQYCQNLLGFWPDYVFTHVTRLVVSKALWRDVRVLEHLDHHLAHAGKTAVAFFLTTEIGGGRPSEEVHRMEAEYGWPVHHREGYPDLVGNEIDFYHAIAAFNGRSRAIQIVFVNQFGWNRERCGTRMPAEMEFLDIRKGPDVEFGQSIYEPFGIAQVEPLGYGALCVPSNVCGCVGFLARTTNLAEYQNVVVADYTTLGGGYMGLEAVLQIGWAERDAIERRSAADVARTLAERLPRAPEEEARRIQEGYQVAARMSWDVVVRDYFLPGLQAAWTRSR